MNRMKQDGINSIGIVIPWGEFQPYMTARELDTENSANLDFVLDLAEKNDFLVFMRMMYSWDCRQDVDVTTSTRNNNLFAGYAYQQEYQNYLGMFLERFEKYRGICQLFVSWEDFLVSFRYSRKPKEIRLEKSRKMKFGKWLSEKYSRDELVAFGLDPDALGIAIPHIKEKGFQLYLEFFNYLLLTNIYAPMKSLDHSATLEIRVDADPVKREKKTHWFFHAAQYDATKDTRPLTYWNSCMGMENTGRVLTAEESLKSLNITLEKIKSYLGHSNHVISQFNIVDNTILYDENDRIDLNQVTRFMDMAWDKVKKNCAGIGIWTYQDYEVNMVYNSCFQLGSTGWTGKDLRFGEEKGQTFVSLSLGSSLEQDIHQDVRVVGFVVPVQLKLEYEVQKLPLILEVNFAGRTVATLTVNDLAKSGTAEFNLPPCIDEESLLFQLVCKQGGIKIMRVSIYSFTQYGGFYHTDGTPGPFIAKFRELFNEDSENSSGGE
jgi:hypothetical protein